MRRHNVHGFTLIELMIVVGIISILAAIAIPGYVRYEMNAKTAEARMNIGAIRTTQVGFLASYDRFASLAAQPTAVPGPTKANWPDRACPATCSRRTPALCTEFSCINFRPQGAVYYQYATNSRAAARPNTSSEFAVGAVADLDADGVQGSFALQTASVGTTGILVDPISACSTPRNANEVVECRYGRY